MLSSKTAEKKTAPVTRVSNTPDNVTITAQRMGFEFGDQVPR